MLRERWGFPFYVVSDWNAVHDTKKAILAGNDMCMGSDDYLKDLPGLVASGAVAGDEVVQLYLSDKSSKLPMPTKQKRTVNFTLSAEGFYCWNEHTKAYEVHPGAYAFKVGSASDKLPLGGAFMPQAGAARPDLKVTQVFTVPRYPRPGPAVTFYAMVKNMGTTPVLADSQLGVAFTVDRASVGSLQGLAQPLLPGPARLLPATTNHWQPTTSGTFTVGAVVDERNAISEWQEGNNRFSRPLKVY